MKNRRCFTVTVFLLCLLFSLFAKGSREREFTPAYPVELIVPAASGGGSDLSAQAISTILFSLKLIEEPFTIALKPGGAGEAGFSYLKSRPNPNSSLMVFNTSHLLNLYLKLKEFSFTPIARFASDPIFLVSAIDGEFTTIEKLLTHNKEEQLLVGTADVLDELCVEMLKEKTDLNLRVIYFNSASSISQGLCQGRLQLGILNSSELLPNKLLLPLATYSDSSKVREVYNVPSFSDLEINLPTIYNYRYLVGSNKMDEGAKKYWEEVLRELVQSQLWTERYLLPNNLIDSYLDSEATGEAIEKEELSWVRKKGLSLAMP